MSFHEDVEQAFVDRGPESIGDDARREERSVVVNARVNGNRSIHGNRIGATGVAMAMGDQRMSFLEEVKQAFVGRGPASIGEGVRREERGVVVNARVNGNRSVHGKSNSSGKRPDNGCRSPKRAPKDRNRGYAMRCFDRGWQWQ